MLLHPAVCGMLSCWVLPRAGKHVLSEKPAAPTLEQAQQLLAFYRSLPQVQWGCSYVTCMRCPVGSMGQLMALE
jgi:hypothetical protein